MQALLTDTAADIAHANACERVCVCVGGGQQALEGGEVVCLDLHSEKNMVIENVQCACWRETQLQVLPSLSGDLR